jgi:futalosine hydrolase
MMNILCVSATEFEIAPFLKAKPGIDFLICGVGVPASIYHLAKRLQQIDYDLVIQAGIAGSFKPSLKLAEVVFVKQDCFADLGITEQHEFFTIFEKGLAVENDFPFKKGSLKNPEVMMDLFPLKKVKGITINTVSDDKSTIKQLVKKFKPMVETMEGAALHYVCLQEKVPFLQLRSISNYVGERDKTKWTIKDAIRNLNETLFKIVDHLQPGTIEH